MFLDALGVEDDSELDRVDMRIVGAGAAGIIMDLELAKASGKIVVPGSNSFALEAATRDLHGS